MDMANESSGTIKISDEVIATITSVAVSEVEGVCGVIGSFAGEIASKFSKKNTYKGIKVSTNENETIIDINIIVKYGIRIPEIAWEVQENVKKSVESMSGLSVVKVNIHVVGVEFDDSKASSDSNAENTDFEE